MNNSSDIYDEQIEELRTELNFPREQMEIAVRAKFCCEYCGKSLIDSVDAYDSWQIDHITPNGDNDIGNLALSCKTCNFAKRGTNTKKLEKTLPREDRLDEAKRIVMERRNKKENTLKKVQQFARLLLKKYDV